MWRLLRSALVRYAASLSILPFVCCTTLRAQATSSGTVAGQVTDASAAVIGSAEVNLVDTQTQVARSTLSNSEGRYNFVNVQPGVYDVVVRKSGFAESKVSAQTVQVGLTLTLNFTLQVGSTATTVDVAASAGAELQTTNATIGNTISGPSMILLPNLGRDASSLAVLQVGVTPSGNVAGTAADQSTFQLDGGNNTDDMAGTNSTYTPSNGYSGTSSTGGSPSGVIPTPVESIEEFKVGVTNQTADFNNAGGSQIQMVTKRGTNDFHGALYEFYFASNIGAANNWLNNHTPDRQAGLGYTPLPDTHRNRFGGAFGGPLTPKFWGGKTYFFVNYEGYRFPNETTVERAVPTQLMRDGVIQLPNSAGVYQAYNLNPYPITVNGKTYQPAVCSTGQLCDPRGIGLNPVVSQIWSKYMPLPNDPQFSGGDQYNTQGYLTNVALPITSNFGVVRLDHDFGEKNQFTSSYRFYKFDQLTSDQVDIGGLSAGDTLGQATATSNRPQEPWYYVAGLTTTMTSNLTNDVHFSYLRNYWQWSTLGGEPQLSGLGGAVEIGGETTNALIPINVNTSSTRQRLWDGQDQTYRDDVSWLKGNHLVQFGGSYQRNHDYTQRNDNGVNIDTSTVYQLTNGTGIAFPSAYLPAGLPSSQLSNYENLYTEVLGLVAVSQNEYTRGGSSLSLNPLGTTESNTAVLPSYYAYISDTWHFRPTFTFTYGLSYTVDMPPSSSTENQLVYSNGTPVSAASYLAQRESAALAGQSYDPILGFETLANSHRKYLFNPFYGGVSPRLALAWNPKFGHSLLGNVFGDGQTVIRGGYSRIYGRLNGIRMAFTPLLGAGDQQAVQCIGPTTSGTCAGTGGANPSDAFRIGTDGLVAPLPTVSQTLAQPYLPGINGNAAAADGNLVDPNFKPNRSDEFNFTIQRALSSKISIEAGYIGRIIKNEFQLINLNAVPTMTTLDGQSFANAFANLYGEVSQNQAIQAQPFFEAALGGSTSSYCKAYASCTAAVASLQKSTITSTQVFNLWSALNSASSWTLGRTLLSSAGPAGSGIGSQLQAFELSTSLGYGNYNAAFVSFNIRDWHGLTTHSNFTWSRAMGTGSEAQSASGFSVVDPWNLQVSYGPQPFDIRFLYNLVELYQVPFFKDQRGVIGHLLGGWSVAPIFTAQSGAPLEVSIGTGSNTDAQSFGEFYGGGNNALENAVLTTAYTGGNSAHYNVAVSSGAGINGNAATGGSGINMFSNPNAIFSEFRPLILGLDTSAGGAGVIRGFPTWNLDATVSKSIRATERINATLLFQFTNILNHFQPANPTLNIDSPQTWGVVNSQSNTPRQLEFGLRVGF